MKDSIQKEIDRDYIVNLLDNYIEYQNKHYLDEKEKEGILRFIVYLMYKGRIFDE